MQGRPDARAVQSGQRLRDAERRRRIRRQRCAEPVRLAARIADEALALRRAVCAAPPAAGDRALALRPGVCSPAPERHQSVPDHVRPGAAGALPRDRRAPARGAARGRLAGPPPRRAAGVPVRLEGCRRGTARARPVPSRADGAVLARRQPHADAPRHPARPVAGRGTGDLHARRRPVAVAHGARLRDERGRHLPRDRRPPHSYPPRDGAGLGRGVPHAPARTPGARAPRTTLHRHDRHQRRGADQAPCAGRSDRRHDVARVRRLVLVDRAGVPPLAVRGLEPVCRLGPPRRARPRRPSRLLVPRRRPHAVRRHRRVRRSAHGGLLPRRR